MAYFFSARDAELCTMEIQEILFSDPGIQVRIGIHFGEVIFEHDNIFCDQVNIVSRIESLADPGGIYVSKMVVESIDHDPDTQTKSVGKLKLKNVKVSPLMYLSFKAEIFRRTRYKGLIKALTRYWKIPLKLSTILLVILIPLLIVTY